MSKVNKEEIRRLGELASLHISEAELDLRVEELNNVLTYTEMMNKVAVATNNVEITQNIHLPIHHDESRPSFPLEKVVMNAPDRQDFFFKVPRMIGES